MGSVSDIKAFSPDPFLKRRFTWYPYRKSKRKLLTMKNIIFIIIAVLVVGWGAYFYYTNYSGMDEFERLGSDNTALLARVANAEITIPDADVNVTLSNGKADFFIENTKGTVSIPLVLGFARVSDGYDVFADLVVDTGMGAPFHYLALFRVTKEGTLFSSSIPVGDKVTLVSATPQTMRENDYELTLQYLEPNPKTPEAEPSEITEINLFVSDGVLEQ